MIVRREGTGWLLISQMAHAWLAGELASAWGNEQFSTPDPFAAVVLATRLHDIGWLEWDAAPRLDDDYRPINFINTTLTDTIPIWRRAIKWVSLLDSYAGLLVSKHASTIYRRRRERGVDPPEEEGRLGEVEYEQITFQKAIIDQLATHPIYGTIIDDVQLRAAYRWLRACDLISLVLCAEFMPGSGLINEVPGNRPGTLTDIRYNRPEPFAIQLTPYPFAKPSLQYSIQTRTLMESGFSNQSAYLAALKHSPPSPQTMTITSL